MCSFDAGGENLEVVAWKPSATLDKKRKSHPSLSPQLSSIEVQIMWCQWMLLNLYPIDWTLAHLCFALLREILQCIVGKVYGDFHLNLFVTFWYLTLESNVLMIRTKNALNFTSKVLWIWVRFTGKSRPADVWFYSASLSAERRNQDAVVAPQMAIQITRFHSVQKSCS